ncbi:Pectin lyase fold [Phytophthora cactorum]|nr:Pectin lyase fold [Phytophthora cactorum]
MQFRVSYSLTKRAKNALHSTTQRTTTTRSGLNGIRIRTIIDLYGSITGATYTDNTLSNVENAIVFYLDYSKSEGVYTGGATSKVEITDITISGLSGTADAIYDILVNADVVGHHSDR